MNIEKIKRIQAGIEDIFGEMTPGDFCGCEEGDLTNEYPSAVRSVMNDVYIILLKEEVE